MTASPAIHDLREAVARALAIHDGWENPDAPWTDNIGVLSRGGNGDPVWMEYLEPADAILAGPIASEHARLTERAEKAEAERGNARNESVILRDERDEARAAQRAMLIQVGEHARAQGEAEGALAISEKAGIVEGWRARAIAAETELTILRAAAARDAEVIARMRAGLVFYADEGAWSSDHNRPWCLTFESPERDGHGFEVARAILTSSENADV